MVGQILYGLQVFYPQYIRLCIIPSHESIFITGWNGLLVCQSTIVCGEGVGILPRYN